MTIEHPIRVCHFSTVHRPTDVRVRVRECQSLAEAGYEVHLVIRNDKDELVDGIHIHALPKPSSRIVRVLVSPWTAMRMALQTKSQIYHYHDPELIGIGFLLRWLFRKRVIFDVHECIHKQLESKPYMPRWAGVILGQAFRVLEAILTVGQTKVVANANSVKDYPGCTLVQNFPRIDPAIPPTPRNFPTDEKPLLVYVGQMSINRGALVYLDLAADLKERGREFHMALIGEYTDPVGQQIGRRVADLAIDDVVTVTGRMNWLEAMKHVSNAQVGLCLLQPIPNYQSCLSTKIIEYMMLGTPVLASDFDCWRPFVEGERVGLMVDPTDRARIVDACEALLSDPQELQAMSQRGQTAVQEKYHWQNEFENLLTCYRDLLNS